eukprot:CAMPEP_0173281382 /NCGR_PEP_ID=MMETSP1143-20121109/6203_1 /TAXON_ID=483371 /ORGANISM="non described non described, Strain CCMP2298" /LENGTH=106 /DNA_ID=CAMNT_0014218775 /DNA_START=782 /DNA_END=1102 /DNA_ORIENTATION=-
MQKRVQGGGGEGPVHHRNVGQQGQQPKGGVVGEGCHVEQVEGLMGGFPRRLCLNMVQYGGHKCTYVVQRDVAGHIRGADVHDIVNDQILLPHRCAVSQVGSKFRNS